MKKRNEVFHWIDYPLREITCKYSPKMYSSIEKRKNRIIKSLEKEGYEIASLSMTIYFEVRRYETAEEINNSNSDSKIVHLNQFLFRMRKYKRFLFLPINYDEFITFKNYEKRRKAKISRKKK